MNMWFFQIIKLNNKIKKSLFTTEMNSHSLIAVKPEVGYLIHVGFWDDLTITQ